MYIIRLVNRGSSRWYIQSAFRMDKIGEKAARQIILDLKGKIDIDVTEVEDDSTEDLMDTLSALGYKTAEIKKVIGNIDHSKSLEEQVKEALRLLLK